MSRPTEPDLYAVLGVDADASDDALKQAYRKQVREHHPDHNPGNRGAEARLQAVTSAYEVLRDPAARRAYDARRAEAAARPDWTDRLTGRRRPERGADLKVRLALDLEEIATGVTRTLAVDRAETCDVCAGTGARPGTTPEPCPTCAGRGTTGGWGPLGSRCRDCRGTGRRFAQSCPVCGGARQLRTKRRIEVHVPAATESGTRLRIAKEGDAGTDGGARGDLYVVVEMKPHALLRREGLDLVADMALTVAEAALGAEVEVPTLEGTITLRVEPGLTSGREVRRTGGGLRDAKGRTGDLRVNWRIELPAAPTSAQRRHLEALRELDGASPPSARFENARRLIADRGRARNASRR